MGTSKIADACRAMGEAHEKLTRSWRRAWSAEREKRRQLAAGVKELRVTETQAGLVGCWISEPMWEELQRLADAALKEPVVPND